MRERGRVFFFPLSIRPIRLFMEHASWFHTRVSLLPNGSIKSSNFLCKRAETFQNHVENKKISRINRTDGERVKRRTFPSRAQPEEGDSAV